MIRQRVMAIVSPPALRTLLLGLVIGIGTSACSNGDEQRTRETALVAQVDSLRAFMKATRSVREDLAGEARPIVLMEREIEDLRRIGLADPLVDLAKDLRAHPELIPLNPVPSGMSEFGFYDPKGVHLLTSKWVLAAFDDGHGQGHMLLEFSLGDSGSITWKPVAWGMDD